MVDAFISQELKEKQDEYQKKAEEMMKSTKKRNQKETKEDGQESAISVENRSFILKYLIMFPSIFKMTEGENAVDIDNLGRLLSVVKTEKLGVKAISMLIVAISDKEKVKILIEKYLKWNAIAHSKSTEVVLNSFVALLIYSDINRDIIDSLLNSCIEILPSILHGKLLHHSHNFIKSLWRRFKHKMHRAKSETSEKHLDEIISSSFIQIIKHVLKYINKIESIYEGNNFAHDNYQLLLELLTDVINFMGADITIFTPFVFQIVKLYHKILHSWQVNLSLRGKTSSMSLSSFIILMLEKNDAFFCKNQDKQKTEKQGADNKVKGVRLTNEQLNNPNLINKYFQDLLNLLKVSVGLYYNSGRNIAFPEFSSTITFRLRKIIQSYDELLLNLKNKNANEEHKDSRIPIYSARQKKIEKIISSIQKWAKATLQVRNQYAKTVNVETHQLLKMIDYWGTGYELDQPGLYKEAINMITNK